MKQNKSESSWLNIAGITTIIIGVITSFYIFYSSNISRIKKQNEKYVEDITIQRANLLKDIFDENIKYIESAALIFENEFKIVDFDYSKLDVEKDEDVPPETIKVISDLLKKYEKRFAFNYLRFIDKHGRDFTTATKSIQAVVSDREYFRNGISGKPGMTFVPDSKVTKEKQLGFYHPIYLKGEIVGIAVGFYGENYIKELLSMAMFGYNCDVMLCNNTGTVLFDASGHIDKKQNFLDYISDNIIFSKEEKSKITVSFSQRRNAIYNFMQDGKSSIGYIAYIGDVSKLFIVMNFPSNVYSDMLYSSNLNGITLLILLISIFLIAGLAYTIRFFLQKKKIIEEAKDSNDIHTAVSLLFENFVVVDVASRNYKYIEGMPETGGIPEIGSYDLFLDSLLERFPIPEEKEDARKKINFDTIVNTLNKGLDTISYNLHAPIKTEEWFTYNFIVISRTDGKVKEFIVARQDITILHNNEEEIMKILEKARDDAEKGNKAKSDFLASMSHDIRTPMNAIMGFTKIATDHIDDKELVKESLSKINTSSEYLLSLINDVLDMAKIESGKMQLNYRQANFSDIFSKMEDIVQAQAEKKKLKIYFDISKIKHIGVVIDELRFNQVLINIISNAIKYTPEGKEIFVTGSDESLPDKNRSKYVFSVKDTGIGMKEEFIPHIFESFSREKSSMIDKIQGTGLGMAITARIVKIMGGTINVKSKLGEGSEFIITLELENVENASAVVANYERIPVPTKEDVKVEGKRILLVEDNDINAEIAKMVITEYGYKLDRAVNGKDGFEKIQNKDKYYYNAVLMDIQMPIMTGYEATKAIRNLEDEYYKKIPIIAMSANAYDEDVKQAIESGMNAHIAKPFDVKVLIATLKKYSL